MSREQILEKCISQMIQHLEEARSPEQVAKNWMIQKMNSALITPTQMREEVQKAKQSPHAGGRRRKTTKAKT